MKKIAGLVVGAALVAAIATGCGGSSGSSPSSSSGSVSGNERELLEQTEATLANRFHPVASGLFNIPAGTCTIDVIAVGADAPAYEGYPWTVESPDGEVAIKVGASDGALNEDCNQAIEEAMGW